MSGRSLLEKTAAALELPPEVALDEVKLSVTGGRELRAVNHRGLLVYESGRIVFRCRGGSVTVSGRDLRISELNEERLTVRGRLLGVLLPQEGEETLVCGGRDEG